MGDDYKLTPEEELKCEEAFAALLKEKDRDKGTIYAGDLKVLMEMMGQQIREEEIFRMVSEADYRNDGYINIYQFKQIIAEQKRKQGTSAEKETIESFVSMGGKSDRSGVVDANKLIEIIKNQFEMTIDIEKLISEIDEDGSGEIEYEEFKSLLQSTDWKGVRNAWRRV